VKKQMVLLGIVFMLTGCASGVPKTEFIQQSSQLAEGSFFKQEYTDPTADFRKYTSIKIEPVTLAYLENREKHKPAELSEVTRSFLRYLEEALSSEGFRVLPATAPSDVSTLIISPALITLGAPQRTLNVISSALIWTPVTSGSASFAAKLKDGESGAVLGEIAEKNTGGSGNMKSLVAGSYTKYTHAEAAFENWGQHLARMLKAKGVLCRTEAAAL